MKITALTLLLAAAAVCEAQEPPRAKGGRPKVGVALGGGAALGLSHVGVLQWLEEHRIPVDYIAGTSMGGLVAGLYSSGMDAAEMADFVQQIDWELALAPTAPYRDLSFRRKEDTFEFPTAFEMGLRDKKLNLPSGLSPGEGVSLVIDRFAAPYGNMKSFDDLPVPFRCVAADLTNRKAVVFENGSLFDALRATMSLPALFAPFRKDGRTLVDGGLANNLPVDVVRKMGADVVIAVALDVPPDPRDFQSLLGVAGQSISFMVMENERPSMAAADILVMPSLKGMAGGDYKKWEQFRKIGYAAAEQKARMLQSLQVPQTEYDSRKKVLQAKRRPVAIQPAEILVEGDVAPNLKRSVVAALEAKPGTTLDRARLEEQMLKLTGTGRFETATYEFRSDGGQEKLIVKVREKRHGPPFVRPTLFLDGATGEGMRWGIGARLTFLDIGGSASEWRSDFSLGTLNRLSTEYYYRIRGGKWFVAPKIGLTQEPFPLYDSDGSRLVELTERDYRGGADLGYASGRRQEFRAGYQYGYFKRDLETGILQGEGLRGQYGATSIGFRRDTRNNPFVPTAGMFGALRISWFDRFPSVTRQFGAYEGTVSYSHPFSAKYSLLLRAAGASTVSETSLYAMFRLGGLSSMSALSRQQLIGNRMYYGHAYVLRAIGQESVSVFGKFYGVIGYEAGQAWYPGKSARPRHDGLIGIVGATQLGVFFLGGSVGDEGDKKLLFRVGRSF